MSEQGQQVDQGTYGDRVAGREESRLREVRARVRMLRESHRENEALREEAERDYNIAHHHMDLWASRRMAAERDRDTHEEAARLLGERIAEGEAELRALGDPGIAAEDEAEENIEYDPAAGDPEPGADFREG